MTTAEQQFWSGYLIEAERKQQLLATAKPIPAFCLSGEFNEPEEIDCRPWMRIENQGSMGSCQGHAQTTVGEYCYHVAMGEVIQFSPLFAYIATQRIDGISGDRGSTIAGGVENAETNGLCPLEVCPYPDPVRYTRNIPDAAYEAAKPFKIRQHCVFDSYAGCYGYLATGQGAIEIGIGWGGSESSCNGVMESYRGGRGGHALALVGYSRRKDSQGRKYLWLANSWDIDWGNGGWAEVAPRAIEQMLAAGGTFIGMSDLTTPKPRLVKWAKFH